MKRKRNTSLGCLFWIALILLVLVIFLFNRKRIENVMEATGFIDILATSQESPQIVEPDAQTSPETVKPDENPSAAPEDTAETESETAPPPDEAVTLEVVPDTPQPDNSNSQQEPPQDKRLRRANLYFVFHDGTAGELRRMVRPVYYSDSPLTDTLKALFEGPSSAELNQNLISLIPRDSAIKSVAVKDGVAYIDMSADFRFNAFGYEGSVLQLKQIIYTATEFPTVNAVQFLIEGQKQQYLNPEGLYIGKPLGRDSL